MNPFTTSSRTLVVERDLPHSPEKIWRALTQASLINRWLMSNDFSPVVGHRFTLRTQPTAHWNGVIECGVLVVEPNLRLSYSWASMGLETTVTWTLRVTPNGTRLRMEQAGFDSEEGANFKGARYGWQKFFDGLEQVVGELS